MQEYESSSLRVLRLQDMVRLVEWVAVQIYR